MNSQPTSSDVVDEITATTEAVRDEALGKLGVVGDEETGRFFDVMRQHDLRLYPLVALGLLSVVDTFQGYAFSVLTPEISATLGLSVGAIGASVALSGFSSALSPLPMAALCQNKARRALLCLVTAFGWSFLTLGTGFVTSLSGLLLVMVANGLTSGSVTTLHTPLLMDSYHPQTRVRVLSAYAAVGSAGAVASPLLVVACTGLFDLTWRGVFVVLGAVSTLTSLLALRLRDPGFGAWDTERVRQTVHEHDDGPTHLASRDVALRFWEICRRLLLIPTTKRLLVGFAIFGVLTVPMAVFFSFFLQRQWDLSPAERGLFAAAQAVVSIVALLLYGSRGEKLFRRDPTRVLYSSGLLLAVALVSIVLGALSPTFAGMTVGFCLSSALVTILGPSIGIAMMSITPAAMRPHLGALTGMSVASGGIAGALFLGGIESRYGIAGAMVSMAVPGVIGSLVIASAGRFIRADLDRMIEEVVEDEKIRSITADGRRPPLLACRGVDFSYGQVQVLHKVDFTVDDGEMVALLGVNGAGKSTLLNVISGIGLPSQGTVRLRGQDITYIDAERRVGLGITQIPGGRAVFDTMTVEENLRSFGYTVARSRRHLAQSIDECYERFPPLLARRTHNAASLSGGEQQMLALCKALILQPALLLIDELSLGLAPVVVGDLLEMVRRINAGGTAVVIVEQSINVALSLATHAYFMEKGQIRFDGRSSDLLARDDLLRAVFLTGAGAQAAGSA